MTLIEKIKNDPIISSKWGCKNEIDEVMFMARLCPDDFPMLKGYYDEEKKENICGSCERISERCLLCWNLEYIENADTDNVRIKSDNVNHPEYYQGKHECIDIMRVMFGDEAVKGFCKCNAFKYRFRAGRKEGNSAEQDINKAEWYEEYLFEMEKEDKHD